MKLTLLTRQGCGLCEDAAHALRDLGLDFEPVDIDQDAGLRALYNDAVPVVLLDGLELCRAPFTKESLRSVLKVRQPEVRG
jgi:glutaredoxin